MYTLKWNENKEGGLIIKTEAKKKHGSSSDPPQKKQQQLLTDLAPFVAVVDVEHFAVEDDVDAVIEVLPVPVIAYIVLRQPLSLD